MSGTLRIGTRSSPLALWQTGLVRELLSGQGVPTGIVPIETAGDLDRLTPLARFGQPAVFSRELDEALLDNRIDLAVHSLKDLPTALPRGISIAAVSSREDPRDALVGRGLLAWSELPQGATVASSSLRRQAQLRRARPDLNVVELRGNIGTRLEQLDRRPEWDAILLATAGLVRLGLGARIGERLSTELMLPAPGQGALAVTARSADAPLQTLVRLAVDDTAAHLAVAAERGLLHQLEGGCHVPVGAIAEWENGPGSALRLRARILSLDGRQCLEGEMEAVVRTAESAMLLGEALAGRLLVLGADRILGPRP